MTPKWRQPRPVPPPVNKRAPRWYMPRGQTGPDAPPPRLRTPAPERTEQAEPALPVPQREPTSFDIILGAGERTPQFGLLGKHGPAKVAINLNGCDTISLFGVQGAGKSYTLGVIAEMAVTEVERVNVLPKPLGAVLFHYSRSDTYEPEHAAAIRPNEVDSEVDRLLSEYGAAPAGLTDVVMLTPVAKVEERRREYPDLAVEPLTFSSAEIGPEGWKFLLGAAGNDSLYIRQLVAIMRNYRDGLNVDQLRQEILGSDMSPGSKAIAESRLKIAEPYIDDSRRLGDILRPGRTVIVDLRDQWIEKGEALGLFVVMLRIFASTKTADGEQFNKLFVFDEAHRYITDSELVNELVEMIRQMRHIPATVVIASQDPMSVARAALDLTSIFILHRMPSPLWVKHIKGSVAALENVDARVLASLPPGQALVCAQRSNAPRMMSGAQLVTIRPRFTAHGGATKTAVRT